MWLPAIALDSSQYRSFEPMSSDSKTSNFSIIYCLLSVHRRFRHQGKRWWEGRTNHSKEIIQTICCFESIRREKLKKQKTPEFVRPSLRYLIVISTILSIINKLNMGFYSVSEQVTKPTCAHVISYNFDDPPSLKAKQLSCLCLILISPKFKPSNVLTPPETAALGLDQSSKSVLFCSGRKNSINRRLSIFFFILLIFP